MARQNTMQRKSFLRSPLKIGAILVVVAAIAVAASWYANSRSSHHSKTVSGTIKTINTTSNPSTPSSTAGGSINPGSAATSPEKTSGSSQPSVSNNLAAPYGSFVSNHKPGQNGSDLTELSQCNTTPGATCYIKFTLGDVTQMLPAQTVTADGTTFWEWKISDAGLTSGKWTITAVASLNGQTKSTTDQLLLEVQ